MIGKAPQFSLKQWQSGADGICDDCWQDIIEISGTRVRQICRMDLSQAPGRSAFQKVAYGLYRRSVPAACVLKSSMLQIALPSDPSKDVSIRDLFRFQRNQQCAVGVFSCAPGITHSVCNNTADL